MLCPNCKTELLRLQIQVDGHIKEVWSHPDTLKNCDYKNDGIEVRTSVVDELLMTKFQELIERDGIRENDKTPLIEKKPLNILNDRLCSGEIDIFVFDEIKKRID